LNLSRREKTDFNLSRRERATFDDHLQDNQEALAVADNTYKKVEIVGTSSKSFSEAVANAVQKAAATLHHLDWFEVVEQRGRIENGNVAQFQVTIKIGFRVD
jgi:flavin-binding protein dodecin